MIKQPYFAGPGEVERHAGVHSKLLRMVPQEQETVPQNGTMLDKGRYSECNT